MVPTIIETNQKQSIWFELSKTKCDCVKFQIYEPNEIVNKKVLCKDYGLDKIYDITALNV